MLQQSATYTSPCVSKLPALAALLGILLATAAPARADKRHTQPGAHKQQRGAKSPRIDLKKWAQQRRWDKPAHVARLMLKSALTPLPEFDAKTFAPRPPKDPARAMASIQWDHARRLMRRLERVDGAGVGKTSMKALERLVGRHAQKQPFRKLYVVSELHLLDTMKGLLEGMVDSGMLEQRMVLQGVRHSQQNAVIDEMRSQGLKIRAARPGALKEDYRKLVKEIVRKANKEPEARFLVVGHGGRLHAVLSQILDRPGVPKDLARRIGIVETTRKGELRMDRMRKRLRKRGVSDRGHKPRLPFVDIGDYWAKTIYESPTIGLGCARSMHAELKDLTARGARGLDVGAGKVPLLVVGYGNVGRHSARMLRKLGYAVHVYDRKFKGRGSRLAAEAAADGMTVHTSLEGALSKARPRVIGSATGEQPWNKKTVGAIPNGAVVFNLASPGEMTGIVDATRQRAASGGNMALRYGGRLLRLRKLAPDHQESVRLTTGGKEVLLARGGKVINLAAGGKEPAEYIQLTRGLVFLAALKGAAIIGKPPGRYQMDDRAVKRFVGSVQRELKKAGLGPLESPTSGTNVSRSSKGSRGN